MRKKNWKTFPKCGVNGQTVNGLLSWGSSGFEDWSLKLGRLLYAASDLWRWRMTVPVRKIIPPSWGPQVGPLSANNFPEGWIEFDVLLTFDPYDIWARARTVCGCDSIWSPIRFFTLSSLYFYFNSPNAFQHNLTHYRRRVSHSIIRHERPHRR